MPSPKPPAESWRDCPTAWFAELERARGNHDYERAALAQRQLKRLGVRVTFTRPGKGARHAKP